MTVKKKTPGFALLRPGGKRRKLTFAEGGPSGQDANLTEDRNSFPEELAARTSCARSPNFNSTGNPIW